MNRRIKRVNVSPLQIMMMFTEPRFLEEDNTWYVNNFYLKGLPDDYKVVGATYDLVCNSICLFVHSESFEEILQYEQVPVLKIETEVIKKEGRYRKDEPYRPLL